MGLNIAGIQNILELWQLGYLKNSKKIIEMGSQELHLKSNDFERIIKIAGINNYEKEKFINIENWPEHPRCSSKHFYNMIGLDKYCSLDINKEHGAIEHDYNFPFEDNSMFSQFDIVTDHGTCEHAFNIAEAYRTMHKLCKHNGLIIIQQALWGGNGYYLLDKYFFDGLVAANNYKVLFNSYVITPKTKTKDGSPLSFHVPMSKDLLDTLEISKIESINVYGVLQKQIDSDFKFAYQNSMISKKQGHLGFNRMFYKDPPSYSFIPSVGDDISTKVLIKEIYKRVKKRFV